MKTTAGKRFIKLWWLLPLVFACWLTFNFGHCYLGERVDGNVSVNGKPSKCRIYIGPFHECFLVGLADDYAIYKGDVLEIGWKGYPMEFAGNLFDIRSEGIDFAGVHYLKSWRPDFHGSFEKFKFRGRANELIDVNITENWL